MDIALSIPLAIFEEFLERYLAVSLSSHFTTYESASPPYFTALFITTRAPLTKNPHFPADFTSPLVTVADVVTDVKGLAANA
ncbi:hypothetical protein P7H09_06840 [Paenibacillus larvae]|uniref:Uncharacterized protein n=1 Tax=Paenibacillus larvae TaxID=1464 RepID=A0AAP5N150_9BACL|nr:hypothetical protein [Paenibacillus larvae]